MKYLVLILMPLLMQAAVTHRNGVAITTSSTINGRTTLSAVNGQTLASGAPVFKGVVEGTTTGVVTTWALTGTLNLAAGDLVVVGASGTVDATAVAVGGQACTKILVNNDGYAVAMWYLQNASADAAASVVITAAGSDFCRGSAANYSGIATSGALDQSACNVVACNAMSNSASHTTQNVTTTQASELLVSFDISNDTKTTHTAGANWTKRTAAGTKLHCLLDRVVASTGTYPSGTIVTVDSTGDNRYYELISTFKGL